MKILISFFLILFLTPTIASTNITPDQLVVKLKPNFSLPKLPYVKSIKHLFGDMYVIRTSNLEQTEKPLKNNFAVVYTERNHRSKKRNLPKPIWGMPNNSPSRIIGDSYFNDPLVGNIWSFLSADENGVAVNDAYKEYGTSNKTPVVVAVVDTGVDISHEDLKDNIWINKKEIPNNGIDDDRNGYIDDINGINTLVRDANGKATVNITPTHSHGTHVSGTIAAKQNNNLGIAGIASNVKIMPLRTVPNSGDETDIDVAEAFIYAAQNGARIINCSFGKDLNEGGKLIPDTLKFIADKYSVLVVVAAGNDSINIDETPTFPANFDNDNLLVVASSDEKGFLSYFSNFGKINVDIAAPGSLIYSTVIGNRYSYMSGTSMATPTTAGVAAEILAHHPNLTYQKLKAILFKSITPNGIFRTRTASGGEVNLLSGLQVARIIK